jgi:hypothetical protein
VVSSLLPYTKHKEHPRILRSQIVEKNAGRTRITNMQQDKWRKKRDSVNGFFSRLHFNGRRVIARNTCTISGHMLCVQCILYHKSEVLRQWRQEFY